MKSATQIDMPGAIDFESGEHEDQDERCVEEGPDGHLRCSEEEPGDHDPLGRGQHRQRRRGQAGFDNVKLSKERAQAVVDYLTKTGGVDAARLKAEGFGSAQPLGPNDTDAHRALNRRVEFHVPRLQWAARDEKR